jgi:hypothetical protein
MDRFSNLVLITLLTSSFAVNATDSVIKIDNTFEDLRGKFGMPANVSFLSTSEGEKFETIYFESHKTAYVFDSSKGTSMSLKPNTSFKICRIIDNPETNVGYTCKLK